VGTNRDDELRGTNRDDVIVALGGNDVVRAENGNDIVCLGPSGPHDEFASGGPGRDVLFGGSGKDRLGGGAGADRLFGGTDKDDLDGGNVTFISESTRDKGDVVAGGRGNDDVEDYVGNDLVRGGPGDDVIGGGTGADVQRGGRGDDLIYSSPGDDFLGGGIGSDLADYATVTDCGSACWGGNNKAVVVDLEKGTARGLGTDRVAGFERLYGGDGSDVLKGNDSDNVIYPGQARDREGGRDVVVGRGGRDFLVMDTNVTGYCCFSVTIDLRIGRAEIDDGGVRFRGIENAAGGFEDDVLRGDAGGNILIGRGGDDRIFGRGGDDRLYGDHQKGKDRDDDDLDGGAGDDLCTHGHVSNCER
jgi:Ca2+-binding RTX toxin-like protein